MQGYKLLPLLCFGIAVILGVVGFGLSPNQSVGQEEDLVFLIPVEQEIERGLEQYLRRAFYEAQAAGAVLVLLEVDTLGGAVDAALNIGQLIRESPIPTAAYIQSQALSAGAYISLNCEHILMKPGSSIGAAAVRDVTGNEVDPKITAAWAGNMAEAASMYGRNPELARAMVDPQVVIPGISARGQLLSLGAQEAVTWGVADGLAENREAALAQLGYSKYTVVEVPLSLAEQIARFVTSPLVMPILMSLGLAGLVIEMLAPGFGIPGGIGLTSILLYFFGHYLAGFAGWEHFVLFVIGVILLVMELFIPSFGIIGILGFLCIGGSLIWAAYTPGSGFRSLAIASVFAASAGIWGVQHFGLKKFWDRFILRDELNTQSGYIPADDKHELLGKQGVTLTPLRPAGIASIEGQRMDVVSEGSYLQVGTTIEVIHVESSRVVVRAFQKEHLS